MNALSNTQVTDDCMAVNQTDSRLENIAAEVSVSDDQLLRTVLIQNVREDLVDSIELYVEHRAHGGGEFEKFNYDSKHQKLTVVFVDAEG